MVKADIMDAQLFRRWLIDVKHIAQSTTYNYYYCLHGFMKTNPDIDDITSYNQFLIDNSIKKRTMMYEYTFKLFLEYKFPGKKGEEMKKRLYKAKRNKDYKVERRYLEPNDIEEIIVRLKDKKHQLLAMLQHRTGIRIGDALNIRKEAIYEEEYEGKKCLRIVLIGKGGKKNVVFVFDEVLISMLIDYSTFNTGFDGRIFVTLGKSVKTDYGNPENMEMLKKVNYVRYRQDVSDAIVEYNKFHKTEFSTHDFRRCFARRFWNKYKDMQALKGVLNHANIYTTARYLEQSGLANVEYHKEMQKDIE